LTGYGNLTPKTDIGKLTTIFYALAGIPLMFIYMSTIGSILASSFKYTYAKLCRSGAVTFRLTTLCQMTFRGVKLQRPSVKLLLFEDRFIV
jgi:hypothetical protein